MGEQRRLGLAVGASGFPRTLQGCLTTSSKSVIASRAVAEEDIIRLRVPLTKISRRRIAEARMVIDMNGKIVKDREGTLRQATAEELAAATEVYG